MAVGILAVIGFNLVDTFFVSQLGTDELAAISLTFPIISALQSLTMGLGAGLSSVVSRLKGAGKIKELKAIVSHSLLFSVVLVTAMAITGLLTIRQLFSALGASENLIPLIEDYMSIWYWGIGFIVIPMMGNSAIRGLGDAKTPALIMMIAGFINAVLDPILIFGFMGSPALGIQGCGIINRDKHSNNLCCSSLYSFKKRAYYRVQNPNNEGFCKVYSQGFIYRDSCSLQPSVSTSYCGIFDVSCDHLWHRSNGSFWYLYKTRGRSHDTLCFNILSTRAFHGAKLWSKYIF